MSTSTITVQLRDVNGNDLTAGGDAITLATTLGTLSAVTDNSDGTYTATLTSATTTGTGTLTGTVNATTIADNAAVSFTAGVPIALIFDVQPAMTLAGETIAPPVLVEAVDANGNKVPGFGQSVTLGIENNPGGGDLLGQTTAVAAGGVATFGDLTIDRVGNGYTLRATSGGLASAVSAAFDILSSDVDLEIGMTVSEDQPAPGATVVYTISVTNHGPRSATGVQITGDLPSRMSFVAASASQGSYDPENGVWTVGTLADGAIATLSITVTVNGLADASS